MCEVEAIVNGRPITKSSDDPLDAEALTPDHLLLLRPGSKLPPGVFVKEDSYSRRRWPKCNIWPTPSGEDGLESICHSCKRDRNDSIRQGPLLLMTLCLWSTLEYQDRPGLSVVLPVYTRATKMNVSEV